jgi:hypothetical protein
MGTFEEPVAVFEPRDFSSSHLEMYPSSQLVTFSVTALMDVYQHHAPVHVTNFQKSIDNDAWRWEAKKKKRKKLA